MFCPQCGNSNDSSAKFCSVCGNELLQADHEMPPSPAAVNVPHDTDEFYKAAVGSKNQDYYLRHFARFDSKGKAGVSWHWPAFFMTFCWLLYRKMWLNALLYFFLPSLMASGVIVNSSAETITGIGYLLYFVGIFVLPPMYANALYYRHCKKKIALVMASSHDPQKQLGELSAEGGTSNVALNVALIVVLIPSIVGILAAVAILAYQDYTARTHVVQAEAIGRNATGTVADYYYRHQEFPCSLEQAGFATPLPPSVKEISVNCQNGTVIMTMANAPLAGKALLFVPSMDLSNRITWKCMSREIQDGYLPLQCRSEMSR